MTETNHKPAAPLWQRLWPVYVIAGGLLAGWRLGLFDYLSLISHYQELITGLFDSSDVVYYLLFTALFLWLTVLRLDMERN